jgi:hypothetical protein
LAFTVAGARPTADELQLCRPFHCIGVGVRGE